MDHLDEGLYGLEDNAWLQHLYQARASWVPVYNRVTFYAGMNTTGRSEGVNAFFDAFATSTTNLREFVVKYEQALKQIVKKESDEDFVTEHKYRIVGDLEFLLKHAASIYTRNVFKKFKDECEEVKRYKVEEGERAIAYNTYLVKTKIGNPEEFVVKLNLKIFEGGCECKIFEFIGIPCRHILKVFVRLDIDTIPNHFILPRWRQEANKFRIMDFGGLLKDDGIEQSEALRLSHMCHETSKLACYASSSLEAYTIYMEAIKELSKKLEPVMKKALPNEAASKPPINASENPIDQSTSPPSLLLNPNISQTKGRKKDVKGNENGHGSGRFKSGLELSIKKKQRKCKLCRKSGHNQRKCPLSSKKRRIEPSNQCK